MCILIQFLNENSGAIQAILVVTLIFVTIWYAISTKKMADIMNNQYAFSIRPYLYPTREIDRYYEAEVDPSESTIIQLRSAFLNVGNVSITYFVDEFTLNDFDINPKKVDTILFPGQKGYLKSNPLISSSKIGNGDGLKGTIKVVFWSSSISDSKYYFKREFTLAPEITIIIEDEDFGMYKK